MASRAIQHAIEGAEDNRELGVNDLKALALNEKDVVVGIAASGRTPYVIAGLEYARTLGCRTVGISCNPGSARSKGRRSLPSRPLSAPKW
ncbi:N-acetylmuramic acid-6-phosphate etherase [Citrobacter koseri]|uniref:N-acetylmuramic acid-6-phosphate etherase n=1 Tax=Citrobacter koseri TaxID=545 RepID=A0A2X2VJ78_CITKO|nr:N-acetylmuramic acid-6-phosphate etherase [Citrobacter koseri]